MLFVVVVVKYTVVPCLLCVFFVLACASAVSPLLWVFVLTAHDIVFHGGCGNGFSELVAERPSDTLRRRVPPVWTPNIFCQWGFRAFRISEAFINVVAFTPFEYETKWSPMDFPPNCRIARRTSSQTSSRATRCYDASCAACCSGRRGGNAQESRLRRARLDEAICVRALGQSARRQELRTVSQRSDTGNRTPREVAGGDSHRLGRSRTTREWDQDKASGSAETLATGGREWDSTPEPS